MNGREVTVGAPGGVTPPFDGVIKACQRYEQQGFDAVWWLDHLMSWWPQSIWTPDLVPPAKIQPNPHILLDPKTTIAAIGCHTNRINLGTSVTDALRHPPAVLAQQFLTLDHITKGRVILGIGAGEASNVAPYGLAGDRPISRLEEALKIVRLLWESDVPVDYDGEFWKLRGAVVNLPPYHNGRFPPIWIAGVAPRTLRIVGKLADGWLPMLMPLDRYRQRMAAISQTAVEANRDPDAIVRGMLVYLVIDEDHDDCHRLLDALLLRDMCLSLPSDCFTQFGHTHPFHQGIIDVATYIPSLLPRELAMQLIEAVPFEVVHENVVHGTPDEIADYLRPYIAAGARHVALYNLTFAADERKLGSSFRLMAHLATLIKGM